MNGTHNIEAIKSSAAALADRADRIPFSELERAAVIARETMIYAGSFGKWWDEFWHGYALTVARGRSLI